MEKKIVILSAFASLLLSCSSPEVQKTPNVIILLADDLGYNDLTCYRNINVFETAQPPTCETPNIDRLAEEGVRFTDFYAGAAVCSPSRAALITGRNCTRLGIYNWIPPGQPMHLRSEEITIAELLKEAGYRTGHFGKWHLTSEGMDQPLPNDQGFDYSFFTYNNANPSHEDPANFFRNGVAEGKRSGYACQIVMDEALNWLDTIKYTNNPFFLNIWFNEPHEKVAAPDSLKKKHNYLQAYYGSIENMDLAIGRLLAYLDENNLAQNTLVIFSSDNGSDKPNSNLPLRARKALNFEGGIRDPFIARYPGRIPGNNVKDYVGSFTDIFPTIAELINYELPSDRKYDGESLLAVFEDDSKKVKRSDPILMYRYFHDPVIMMREGDWCLLGFMDPIPIDSDYNVRKLARIKPEEGAPPWSQWGFNESHMEFVLNSFPSHFELYNLSNDIGQDNDLAEIHPEVVHTMKSTAKKMLDEMLLEGGTWYDE